jgi:lipopolysaccharide transport protein LptA
LNKDTQISSLESVNGVFFDKGRPTIKFIAPQAHWYMAKKEIHIKEAIGFDEKSEGRLEELKARAAKNNNSTFNLPIRQKERGQGYFFSAKNLSWSLKDRKLTCRGGIWLTKGDISGSGKELIGDVGLENVILRGDPKIFVTNDEIITIEAREFFVNSISDTLKAVGGVSMNSENVMILSDEILFRQREHVMELAGKVSVSYHDIRAISEKAYYDLTQQIVYLSGNAKLLQGKSRISGDEVIVSIKEKTFKVKGRSKAIISEEEVKNKKQWEY